MCSYDDPSMKLVDKDKLSMQLSSISHLTYKLEQAGKGYGLICENICFSCGKQ